MITVTADIEKVQTALASTNKSLKSIQRQVLGIIGKQTAKRISIAIKQSGLKKVSGELSKGFAYKVAKDGSKVTIFPKGAIAGSDIYPKSAVLSYGHFGGTKRARSYSVAPRGFIQSGWDYAESGNYQSEIDKMVSATLDKYWS